MNQTQIKMKEMITKKAECIKQTNTLLSKKNTILNDIETLKEEILLKQKELKQKAHLLHDKKKQINVLRTDELEMIKQFNINESLYKEGINQINYDNEYIRYGMLPSRSQYIAIVNEKFDELKELKKEGIMLRDRLYLLNRNIMDNCNELDSIYKDESDAVFKAEQGVNNVKNIYDEQVRKMEMLKE